MFLFLISLRGALCRPWSYALDLDYKRVYTFSGVESATWALEIEPVGIINAGRTDQTLLTIFFITRADLPVTRPSACARIGPLCMCPIARTELPAVCGRAYGRRAWWIWQNFMGKGQVGNEPR